MKKVIFSILFLMITTAIFAQKEVEIERSKTAIANLKKGALIIRLPSNHKKLAAMRKSANAENVGEGTKERLLYLIQETEEKTMRDAKLFTASFAKTYNFSPYYLMWDYSLDSLKTGIKKGYFLDENLNRNPNIELKEDEFLTLRHGLSKNQGLESFIVTDKEFGDLEKPFPRYFRLNTFKYFFNSLFFAKTAKNTQMVTLAYEINERFKRFYVDSF